MILINMLSISFSHIANYCTLCMSNIIKVFKMGYM